MSGPAASRDKIFHPLIGPCDLLRNLWVRAQLPAVLKEKGPQGQARMCTLEQMMNQPHCPEKKPPVPSLFQWGSCQAITAETHWNILGEKHSFPTFHWPWGGSASPKLYLAKISLTCHYNHWKMRMLRGVMLFFTILTIREFFWCNWFPFCHVLSTTGIKHSL